jgi:hypothetical protein
MKKEKSNPKKLFQFANTYFNTSNNSSFFYGFSQSSLFHGFITFPTTLRQKENMLETKKIKNKKLKF